MIRRVVSALGLVVALAAPGPSCGNPIASVLERPATRTTLLPHVVLEDITSAGSRLVAVGEHGIIMFSADDGRTWTQAQVPVSVTLTAVAFPDADHGFAVGHGGVVLSSDDGGETWERRLDGREIPAIVAQDARDAATRRIGRQLASDGPDKPLLALCFTDSLHGVVVGAAGIILATQDGGRHWSSWMDRVVDPKGLHFYGVEIRGQHIMLVGEQGLLNRSDDGGKTFRVVPSPYGASYFAACQDSRDTIIAGLRGHVFASTDMGRHFTLVAAPSQTSIATLVRWRDGRLLVFTQQGQVWTYVRGARRMRALSVSLQSSPSAAVVLNDGSVMTVGAGGVEIIDPQELRAKV